MGKFIQKHIWKFLYLIIGVEIGILLSLVIFGGTSFSEWMGLTINAGIMLGLLIVTASYARSTAKMVKEMKRQNTAKLKIHKPELAIEYRSWDDNFKPDKPENKGKVRQCSAEFTVRFIATNRGGAPGSIDKPLLIIKCNKDNISYSINPVTIRVMKYETVDLGKTIYLKPGQREAVELTYVFAGEKYKNEQKIKHFIKHFDSLEYLIRYRDQNNKKFKIPMTFIKDKKY